MGLTVQQLFDYIDGLIEDRPAIVVKGAKDNKTVFYRIHTAHDKFFLDEFNNIDDKKNIKEREVFDKEELQTFKIKILGLLREIKVEDMYIE